MKGTLFSADFVKDTNGNLRLLELNTDTAFTNGALSHVNFNSISTLVTDSNISEFHVIYKEIHKNFIEELQASLASSNPTVTFSKHQEEINTIYPTAIEDGDSKFILRCAYDESAIFDSTYCRQKNELYKLFQENTETGSIAEFYVKTDNYEIDLLSRKVNTQTSPDVAIKDLSNVHNSIEFYKIAGTGSVEENFDNFIKEIGNDKLIVNYYNNISENTQKSYRSFNIIFGSDLEIINLTDVEVEAVFTKPSVVQYNTSIVANPLDEKHYYEFTTNYPHFKQMGTYGGIFEEEAITDINGNGVLPEDLVIGEVYKSTYINGAPDTDNVLLFTDWSHNGSILPTGSYNTSSLLTNKVKVPLKRKTISHIVTNESASFRATGNQHLLVYNSGSDNLQFKSVVEIDNIEDYLVKDDQSLTKIISNDIEILNDVHYTYILDFEDVDTYVLHDNGLNIKVVAHNACFPAGTKILVEDGAEKNIEDIKDGDTVLSYDTVNKKFTSGRVSKVNVSTQKHLVEINTDNGESLTATVGHRIFTADGWKDAGTLNKGDKLINKKGNTVSITQVEVIEQDTEVYHILNVGNDHTYFANDILVHNFSGTLSCFPAGTEILLDSGDIKNIENIVIGDTVRSLNEKTGKYEGKDVYEILTPVHDDIVTYTLEDGSEISSTYDHPFYTEGLELKSFYPEKTNDLYKINTTVTKIKVGDRFIKENGELIAIETIEPKVEEGTQTYLLRVNDNHNYFANNILVHNK